MVRRRIRVLEADSCAVLLDVIAPGCDIFGCASEANGLGVGGVPGYSQRSHNGSWGGGFLKARQYSPDLTRHDRREGEGK